MSNARVIPILVFMTLSAVTTCDAARAEATRYCRSGPDVFQPCSDDGDCPESACTLQRCISGPDDGALCADAGCPGNGQCVDLTPPPACGDWVVGHSRPTIDDCPTLVVGTATGMPGAEVSIPVTMRARTTSLVGFEHYLRFDPKTAIVHCSTNPDLDLGGGGFSIHPASLEALIFGWDWPPQPISDGAVIYTCTAQIDADIPPGSYPIAISDIEGSDAYGNSVVTGGIDGAVVVTQLIGDPLPTRTPAPTPTARPPIDPDVVVTYSGAPVEAHPGEATTISVNYASTGYGPDAVQLSLGFNSSVSVAPRSDGHPDCQVSSTLTPGAAAIHFQPLGCQPGVDCAGIFVVITPNHDDPPGPDLGLQPSGSLLFTCTVQVDADAQPGHYTMEFDDAVATLPLPNLSATVETQPIEITVSLVPTPTFTTTPTGDASGASFPQGASVSGSSTSGSCAIGRSGSVSVSPWLLLLAFGANMRRRARKMNRVRAKEAVVKSWERFELK